MKKFSWLLLVLICVPLSAQNYWQQFVDYKMDIHMQVDKYQYHGKMDVTYANHSDDTLDKIYFHLYYNAFQPGSLMDERLKSIVDPDGRMTKNIGTKDEPIYESRISKLKPDEIGFVKINHIRQGGQNLDFKYMGTILEVELKEPIAPNTTATLTLDWQTQIPKIIRRGGRDTNEGIDFSMTQWYPKVAQYDNEGWHLDEYIGREFYAPFANFDVKITMPSNYIIGASGVLQNEENMPGYSQNKIKRKGTTTWHFVAKNIHDFAWGADTNYVVEKDKVAGGPVLYYLYDKTMPAEFIQNWQKSKPKVVAFFEFMDKNFGKYPWETYSIIHGGDGGMEYGGSTLITGKRNFESLLGVIFHEAAHSWFQHLFAFDETRDEWMDEGFTTYAEAAAMHEIMGENANQINPFQGAYNGYYHLAKSGKEEPMSLLADYYDTNFAYSLAAYYKGQVYVAQLGYIIGEEALAETFKKFYEKWHLKHPKSGDFQKIAQEVSGINLKWYNNLFINTTRTIDFGIDKVENKTISLKNHSNFAMPLDVLVSYKDGTKELFYIPINAMRGSKKKEQQFYQGIAMQELKPWGWTYNSYEFEVTKPVEKVEIDYTQRLADVDRSNNVYPKP